MSPLLLAILNLSIGFLSGVLSIPLVTKGVPQNGTYGFRFRECLQSDEAWYAINAYGGKWMLFWSLILLVVGLAFLFAHFLESFTPSRNLTAFATFAPCLLIIAGVQASLWAGKYFPISGEDEDE